MICPNCGATMGEGDPCPECDHTDAGCCDCDHCSEYETPLIERDLEAAIRGSERFPDAMDFPFTGQP